MRKEPYISGSFRIENLKKVTIIDFESQTISKKENRKATA